MAEKKKTKTRYVDVTVSKGNFVSKFLGKSSTKHNLSDVLLLRQILSNEKARIISTLKTKKPKSIYKLARILGRDFKSVREDLKVLEKFGVIEFHSTKKGKRESLEPILILDKLEIIVNI